MLAAVSSRLEACSSVRCDRSVLPIAISRAPVEIVLVASMTAPTIATIVSSSPLTPPHSASMSPVMPTSGTRRVRSLPFAAVTTDWTCCTALRSASADRTWSVTSVAYFTTLKALPFWSKIGL